jgi:hypothetical protein
MSNKFKTTDAFKTRIQQISPKRCVLNAGRCILRADWKLRENLIKKQPYVFIMRPYSKKCLDMEQACRDLLPVKFYIPKNDFLKKDTLIRNNNDEAKEGNVKPILAKDESFIGSGYCQICSLCQYSHFGIAELAQLNPNVLLEIGLMLAFSKPVIFTLDARQTSIDQIPFDINGLLLIPYQNFSELKDGMGNKISAVIEELKIQDLLK